jgi:dihydrofolate reductase
VSRTLTVDLFITVDGFASGEHTQVFLGYSGPDLHRWVTDTLQQPQVIVMGRGTYQELAAISATSDDQIATRMTRLPKVVISSTLTEPLVWPNTSLLRGDAASLVRTLKQARGDPLRTVGSLRLITHLIRHGLVDRLRLMVFPVILGLNGREPVLQGLPDIRLEFIADTVLDHRLVCLEYAPIRK